MENVIFNYNTALKLKHFSEFPTAKVHTLFIIKKYFPRFLTKFVSHFTSLNPDSPLYIYKNDAGQDLV